VQLIRSERLRQEERRAAPEESGRVGQRVEAQDRQLGDERPHEPRVLDARARHRVAKEHVRRRRNHDVRLEHERLMPLPLDQDDQQPPYVGLHLAHQDSRHRHAPIL
jgi:hypothetical protein